MIQFRQTVPDDLLKLKAWIESDSDHRGIEESFFTASGPGISCYVIEDEKGPVIYVRQQVEGRDCRLHTQFPPTHRKRIVRALEQAYPLVAADARKRGFENIRFESGSIALARVMFGMGFRAELVAKL